LRVLFWNPYPMWFKHFACELELIIKHLKAGDEVYAVECVGHLPFCEQNRFHDTSLCVPCVAQRRNCYKLAGVQNIIPLDLATYMNHEYRPDGEHLKDMEYQGKNIGTAMMSTIISNTHESEIDDYAMFIYQQTLVSRAMQDFFHIKFQKHRINLFYTFNGRFASMRPAINAAENLGIKYFTYDNPFVKDDYRLAENATVQDVNFMRKEIETVWENDKSPYEHKELMAAEYFSKGRGLYSVKNPDLMPLSFDVTKRNIAIFVTSNYELHIAENATPNIYEDQLDALTKLADAGLHKDIHFHVRIHPALETDFNSFTYKFMSFRRNNFHIIPPGAQVSSHRLVELCEKSIVFYSSMGIQANYMGKPVIGLDNTEWDNLDIAYKPRDHHHFVELVAMENLPTKPKLGAVKYGYWAVTHGKKFTNWYFDKFENVPNFFGSQEIHKQIYEDVVKNTRNVNELFEV